MTLHLIINRDTAPINEAKEAMGQLSAAIDKLSQLIDANPQSLMEFWEDMKFERDCLSEVYWRVLTKGTEAELTGVMGRTRP